MQQIPSVIFFENATSPYRVKRGKGRLGDIKRSYPVISSYSAHMASTVHSEKRF